MPVLHLSDIKMSERQASGGGATAKIAFISQPRDFYFLILLKTNLFMGIGGRFR